MVTVRLSDECRLKTFLVRTDDKKPVEIGQGETVSADFMWAVYRASLEELYFTFEEIDRPLFLSLEGSPKLKAVLSELGCETLEEAIEKVIPAKKVTKPKSKPKATTTKKSTTSKKSTTKSKKND